MRAHQANQMRGPHSGSESLATHIAQCENNIVANFFDAEEITGQLSHRKNFVRDVERAKSQMTGGT